MHHISIVLPTIGRENYLDESIKSILNQDMPFNEFILFDNSLNQSLKNNSPFSEDDRITWKTSGRQLPAVSSWNTAVSLASNKYIILMGDDDIAMPWLHKEAQFLLQRSDFGILNFRSIDENGWPQHYCTGITNDLTPTEFRHTRIKGKLGLVVPGTVFSKDTFLKVGGFYKNNLPADYGTDDHLWFRISCFTKTVAFSKKTCWYYRRHVQSVSRQVKNCPSYDDVAIMVNSLVMDLQKYGVSSQEFFPMNYSKEKYISRLYRSLFIHFTIGGLREGAVKKSYLIDHIKKYFTSTIPFSSKLFTFALLIAQGLDATIRKYLPSR